MRPGCDSSRSADDQPDEKPVARALLHHGRHQGGAGAICQDSPGVLLERDEFGAWVNSFDAYRGGRGGDRQDWLSLWAGKGLKVDRKGADPLFIPHPAISVVGGIQPDMLGLLRNDAGQDGFIDRILFSLPGRVSGDVERSGDLARGLHRRPQPLSPPSADGWARRRAPEPGSETGIRRLVQRQRASHDGGVAGYRRRLCQAPQPGRTSCPGSALSHAP